MTIVASVIEHIPEELITKILLPNWPEYYSNHLNYHQFVPKLDVGGYLVVIMENIYKLSSYDEFQGLDYPISHYELYVESL